MLGTTVPLVSKREKIDPKGAAVNRLKRNAASFYSYWQVRPERTQVWYEKILKQAFAKKIVAYGSMMKGLRGVMQKENVADVLRVVVIAFLGCKGV